jgi:hypothetical protein
VTSSSSTRPVQAAAAEDSAALDPDSSARVVLAASS